MAVAAKRAHATGTLQDPRGRGDLWAKRWPTDRRVAGLFPLFTVLQPTEVSPAPLPASFAYYSEIGTKKSTVFFFRIYYLASDNHFIPST